MSEISAKVAEISAEPLPTSAIGHARHGLHDSHYTDNLLEDSPISCANEIRPATLSLAEHGTGKSRISRFAAIFHA